MPKAPLEHGNPQAGKAGLLFGFAHGCLRRIFSVADAASWHLDASDGNVDISVSEDKELPVTDDVSDSLPNPRNRLHGHARYRHLTGVECDVLPVESTPETGKTSQST